MNSWLPIWVGVFFVVAIMTFFGAIPALYTAEPWQSVWSRLVSAAFGAFLTALLLGWLDRRKFTYRWFWRHSPFTPIHQLIYLAVFSICGNGLGLLMRSLFMTKSGSQLPLATFGLAAAGFCGVEAWRLLTRIPVVD